VFNILLYNNKKLKVSQYNSLMLMAAIEAQKSGGTTLDDANTLLQRVDEYNLPAHGLRYIQSDQVLPVIFYILILAKQGISR